MKNVTKTITSREVRTLVFDNKNESLFEHTIIVCGEKFDGVERDILGKEYQVLKVREASEPITKTYIMSVDEFMKNAVESEGYKYGFINRTIGGKVTKCLVFDLDVMNTKEVEYTTGTQNKLEKQAESDNCKLLKILDTYTVDEKYYYMCEEDFIKLAQVK